VEGRGKVLQCMGSPEWQPEGTKSLAVVRVARKVMLICIVDCVVVGLDVMRCDARRCRCGREMGGCPRRFFYILAERIFFGSEESVWAGG
jgi:hypothetical protein